jgi:putative NADH-flavin reductase
MNIGVVGAGGRSGKAFVEAALSAGHTVTAGVHSHNPLASHPRLSVRTIDATSSVDVRTLIEGQDAIVSLIGHVKGSPIFVQTDAIKTVLSEMKTTGITRLVSLTGTGVRFPGDKVSLIDRFMNSTISIIDPARIKDGLEHTVCIQQSEIDWTIIRVLKLRNGKATPFQLTENGPTKVFTSRQEVAEAILQVLTNKTFIKKAPMLSTKRS